MTEPTDGFILVTFGSVTTAKDLGAARLRSMVESFSYFSRYVFLWQLDMSEKYMQKTILNPIGMRMPKNVRLHPWLPVRQLVKHPKVVLVISHGASATSLESIYNGKPVFALPVHSDQFYLAQRTAHKGLGEQLLAEQIEEPIFFEILTDVLGNLKM